MRVEKPDFDAAIRREAKSDLKTLLREAGDRGARPCPGCAVACPECGSRGCTCRCAPDCPEAPRQLSSDPERFPVEPEIVPLVYALTTLRVLPPCWSCEGHNDPTGKLHKLPRVWFYAHSLAYPGVLAECLSDLKIAGKLSHHWRICIVADGDPAHGTFSLEPQIEANETPKLEDLRADAQVISRELHDMVLRTATRHAAE